jgi:hypothetical protein
MSTAENLTENSLNEEAPEDGKDIFQYRILFNGIWFNPNVPTGLWS